MKTKQITKEMTLEYANYPQDILASINKFKASFVHSYPDLDAALNGMNLLDRAQLIESSPSIVVFKTKNKNIKEGDHVFIGAIRVKGLMPAYVVKRTKDLIFIGAMSCHKID